MEEIVYLVITEWCDGEGNRGTDVDPIACKDIAKAEARAEEKRNEEFAFLMELTSEAEEVEFDNGEFYVKNTSISSYTYLETIEVQ